jgi:hypothetical protein
MAAADLGIATSILKPSRIDSLGRIDLRVIEHLGGETQDMSVQVYPFERVLSLKQRIAETYGRANIAHLPEYMFIAVPGNDGKYMPLEYVWNIEHDGQVQDPLNLEIVKSILSPDKHATEHMGMLLEDLVDVSTFREVHVWSLHTIVQAAGLVDSSVEIPSDLMDGFFKLYFPRVSPQVLIQDFSRALNEGETEDADAALAYHTELDKRLEKLDALIPKLHTSCVLNQLYRVLFYIPPSPEFKSSADLELTFYETKVSERVPFVRYFPGNQRSSAPMVKLAESETAGQPLIDQALLSKMLRDLPEMDEEETRYGVLMYKIPVIAPRVPADTMWTLTFFGHDGSASLVLSAPRKDEPLTYEAVSAATALIPTILTAGRIHPGATPILKELNASYRTDVSELELAVPTLKSMESRIDVFQSFVSKSKKLESQRVSLTLRYKTVSNFVKESNPVFDHLTYVTLDKGSKDKLLSKDVYIQELASHFGYSRVFAEKYVAEWAALHSEHIERGKSIFDRVNPGALIGVYANHPKYDFILNNIQSQRDLERILTLMSVFVSNPTSELVIAKSASEMEEVAGVMAEANVAGVPDGAEAAAAAADAAQDGEGEMSEEQMELMYASLGYDEDIIQQLIQEAREARAAAQAPAADAGASAAAPAEAEAAAVGAAAGPGPGTEVKYGKTDAELLTRLYQANSTVFKYKPAPGKKPYSKACQASSGRQPNVMSLPQYRRARELYRDTATWVEAPLNEKDVEAVKVVSSAVSSRIAGGRSERKVYDMELRALELGFPLKGDKSVTETAKAGVFTKEEKDDMKRRIEIQQKSPPLWIVFRLGSSAERPNYYICAEYWCIHDNLPILPSVFEKTNKCPFCGGSLIVNPDSPEKGETVLKRKDSNGVKKYVGFFSELHHPDGYAVPCCFGPPSEIEPPKDVTKPFPPPQMDLPSQQAVAAVAPEPARPAPGPSETEDRDEDTATATGPIRTTASDTYRDRPFTAKRDKVKKNEWFIPHQKIVGRTNEGWVDITPKFRGIVSVPPQTVNALLEQDPETFLTAIHGVQAKSQNSYLAVPGRAFVRYGLGTDGSTPGDNLFSLIAFAEYATAFLHDENANTAIRSNESVLNFMTSDDPINTRRMLSVFEQANYGTLLHEFTVPQVELQDEQLVHFENWWTNTAGRYKSPSDKKYAIQTYLAFENFKAYVKDTSIKKDLRYFMSFFTTPKLLTSQGFIPIVINYYRKNTPATIMCPEFGVSFYNQPPEHRPPLLFIVHDVDNGIFDPMVVYEGVKLPDGTSEQRVCGLIHPKTPSFSRLTPEFRSSIQAFIDKYFSSSAKGGCGVNHPFTHPWMPARDTSRVPRLSELIHVLDLEHKKMPAAEDGADKKAPRDKHVLTGDIRKEALFRDSRSNRLLGVIVRHSQPRRYVLIPCIDDGYIPPASIGEVMKNVRGDLFDDNATFKAPTIEDIFFVLTGKQKTVDETRLAGHFEAYLPVKLHDKAVMNPETGARETRFVAVELACGIWIPCQPARAAEVREIRGKYLEKALAASGASSPVDKMPWNLNSTVLGPERPESESIEYTSEEELDESYQLFRLSFSEWLRNHPSVRDQIELLRRARTRLPLFELQKRLEILITAIVNPNKSESWFTSGDDKTARPIYRRDCLKLKKDECSGGCAWVTLDEEDDGKCLIHTRATERYIQPMETLIARLVDELLRTFSLADEILSTRVPRLPSIQQGSLEHEDGAILFSLPGRGDDDLYTQLGYKGRKPTEHTRGLVFPEETTKSGLFEEGDIPGDMSSEWSALFRRVPLGPELMRDRVKFQTMVLQISGMPIDKYEAHVGHEVIGTDADWKELGEQRKVNIVFTHVNPETQLLEANRLLQVDSDKYVVLDADQIPLQHRTTSGIIVNHKDLPKSIRSWLATQGVSQVAEPPTLAAPAAERAAAAAVAPVPKTKPAGTGAGAGAAAAGPKRRIKYPIGKTRNDGNCFFSAIYRLAKEHGKPVLDQLAKCLGVNASTEPKFIQTFRKVLSDYMKTGKLEPTYKRAKEVAEAQPGNYAAIIESYPKWFTTLFGEFGGDLGTYDEFVNRYSEKIKEDKSWVAEIDIELVTQLLVEKVCNFTIIIKKSNLISKVGELKTMTDDGKIILNLINQHEQHYEYFKMDKDAEDDE